MAYTPSTGASSNSIAGAVNVVLSHYDAADRIGSYYASRHYESYLTSGHINLPSLGIGCSSALLRAFTHV